MKILRRIVAMALWGALGASLGAGAGELLFLYGSQGVRTPKEICLLFDVSGSMREPLNDDGTQLSALKRAARSFVGDTDFEHDRLGLVAFSSGAEAVAPTGSDGKRMVRSIDRLEAGGATNMGRGIELAAEALAGAEGEPWILLFSDGKPKDRRHADPEGYAVSAAEEARAAGVNLVAISTGLADTALLERVTGSPELVVQGDFAGLEEAFQNSGDIIHSRQMLSSAAVATNWRTSVKRASIWAALIAFGAGLTLVVGQNRYLRRRPIGPRELGFVVAGSLVTGLFAGASGQSAFYFLSGFPAVVVAGRIAAWILLGCGVGYGMSLFVPNLRRRRALLAGGIGGAATAAAFQTLVPEMGDTLGRLMGAAILGFGCGLMIVLVEVVARKAWLVVHWGNDEQSVLTLGNEPIVVGKSPKAHICPDWKGEGDPVMGLITHMSGGVRYEDPRSGEKRTLRNGEGLNFGSVFVEVREAEEESQESVAA